MRQIKFRVWDGNKMYDVECLDYSGKYIRKGDPCAVISDGSCVPLNNESTKLMQFTGLQDKNGVDIYEGDLIKNESGRVCKVVWHKYTAQWDYEPITDKGDYNGFESHKMKYQEVIGNIHE